MGMADTVRNCALCGKEFSSRCKITVHCGKSCAMKAYRRKVDPLLISKERLVELYYREQISTARIAKIAGVNAETVRLRMISAGMPRRMTRQTSKLAQERGLLRPFPQVVSPDTLHCNGRRLHGWLMDHPEVLRAAAEKSNRLRSYRSKQKRPKCFCSWCGCGLDRPRSKAYPTAACNRSHQASARNWRRWHSDEPRPLILERLKNGETGIGESQIEWDALAMERLQPVVPRPIPALKPASVLEKPVQRRQKPLAAQEVGPLGEALLKAVREDDGRQRKAPSPSNADHGGASAD